jgi:hypothetical protein
MRLSYLNTCVAMTVRELARKYVVLTLALLLPVVFFAVTFATTGDRVVPVTIAWATEPVTEVDERRMTLLFIGIAAAGIISAFFASSLIQRQVAANRRLVLCGYRAIEIITARLAVLLGIIVATTLYTWLLLSLVASPSFPAGAFLGIGLGAFVYGCYGLLVGTVFRRELESVFAILVLINIDAGWLQNPIYYESSRSKWLIEALPAHFPAQVAYLAAFTPDSYARCGTYALAYGSTFLVVALAWYSFRMRLTR